MESTSETFQMSRLKCEQNVLKNTDGSAMYSEGDTVVLVGVYGPVDCKESRQDVKQAVVDVNFRPKIGIPGVAEKYLEQFVRSICESVILRSLHPRSVFSVIIQVMQDRGSLLSCAINGVSMALQDAGVSMNCVPVAVTVALCKEPADEDKMDTDQPAKIVLNPSSKVEQEATTLLTFVFDSAKGDLLSTYTCGPMSPAEYDNSLKMAKGASKHILKFFRESISKNLSADIS